MEFVITGSVAYDYLMRFPGRFRDHILPDELDNLSVSFLAESMQRERGGVAANVAYTMKLLGCDPVILATVGNDFSDYRAWLQGQGLRTDQIIEIPNELTATFFVSTDLDQNQIANFYTGAMGYARDYSLESRRLSQADIVLISPNDPEAMINYAHECKLLSIPFAFDPSQQLARLDGESLRDSIPGAAYLLCNEYELAMILNKTGWSREELIDKVDALILTLGSKGSVIYTDGAEIGIPPAPPLRIDDPTGAGDAYRGGFFAARLAGLPWEVCGRVGSLCSAYALENTGTTAHSFTASDFAQRYEQVFGAEPRLVILRRQLGDQEVV
ncbi:MAG: carbohydrate kinase family protein [Caldilineaceae bacterium]|jgi:adenosine kinase